MQTPTTKLPSRENTISSGWQTKYSNPSCQRCLQKGHWTFECQNKLKILERPSRTTQLNKNIKKSDNMSRIAQHMVGKTHISGSRGSKKKETDSSSSSSSDSSDSSDSSISSASDTTSSSSTDLSDSDSDTLSSSSDSSSCSSTSSSNTHSTSSSIRAMHIELLGKRYYRHGAAAPRHKKDVARSLSADDKSGARKMNMNEYEYGNSPPPSKKIKHNK